VVEEATVTEGDGAIKVRESDLQRHLSNPDGSAIENKQPAPQPQSAAPGPAPKAPEKAGDDGPPDIVSKNDYQLNQALNLLKGLQILSKK
jgi:carboxyl-terminal processing protease